MRIFVTGASGFIGSALVPELLAGGHRVVGLARSEASAAALVAAGAEAHRGSLEDDGSLRAGAAAADAVVHLAFNHDFSRFAESCADDVRVVNALADGLGGGDRRLIVTSGTGVLTPGRVSTEDDLAPALADGGLPRAASEEAALAATARGIRAAVVRLPQVHDPEKQGLVTYLIEIARRVGFSAYVGAGENRWAAAHRSDVARLYRLACEHADPQARYHAVAEEGVPFRSIAEAIGRRLGVPTRAISADESATHFGILGLFASRDMPASSATTRARLGWRPVGPGLVESLDARREAVASA